MAALPLPRPDLTGARRLLDPLEPAECASPLLAATQYQLTVVPHVAEAPSAAFDDWADLDPSDPAVWHSHAQRLLALLPKVARQIAALATRCERQAARWFGAGGDAMALLGPAALWSRIDPAHRMDSTLALARYQRRDQYAVNRIASTLWRLLPHAPREGEGTLHQGYRHLLEQVLHEEIPATGDLPLAETRRAIASAFLPDLRATAAGLAPGLRRAAGAGCDKRLEAPRRRR